MYLHDVPIFTFKVLANLGQDYFIKKFSQFNDKSYRQMVPLVNSGQINQIKS